MYVGRDSTGFHFSIKDTLSLGMDETGVVLIKGAQGITGTPKAATFTIGILLVLLTLFIVLNLIHSRAGRAIMSIRDNRIAAESIGINITKYKLMAFPFQQLWLELRAFCMRTTCPVWQLLRKISAITCPL